MNNCIVAFQGERGAFSEVAAHEFLGKKIKPLPCASFDILFDRVESKKAAYGVIPIENSLIGSIHRNYDLLLERPLHVIGETYLRISHCLIAPNGTSFKQLRRVSSHPAALDQCRSFFDKHHNIAPISYYDTAGAVKMLAESNMPGSAALAGPFAAELYKMHILRKSMEDEKHNFTRFLLLARAPKTLKGRAKTSIVFAMKNQPGILHKVLSIFALRDIDLTKIESRPLRKKAWQYHFYIDFEGSINDAPVKRALEHLEEVTHFIKILGSYPMKTISV